MTRASNGKGSIYRSRDGRRWEGNVSGGIDPASGKRIRLHVRGRTKAEVQSKVDALINRGTEPPKPGIDRGISLSRWLDLWVLERADVVRPSTIAGYRTDLKYVERSGIGSVPLVHVGSSDIARLGRWLLSSPKRSAGTVDHANRTLRAALRAAVLAGYLSASPFTNIKTKTSSQFVLDPYDRTEITKIITVARQRRNGTRWEVALLGLRRGEVLGLRWSDIDLDRAKLNVNKSLRWLPWDHGCRIADGQACGETAYRCPRRHGGGWRLDSPKTLKSVRSLDLAPTLVARLTVHKAAQQHERAAAGGRWEDHDFVFTTRRGTPIDPTSDCEAWAELTRAAKVRKLRIHDLRHTAATMLLIAGHDSVTIKSVMGWTSQALVDRYVHIVEPVRQRVAASQEAIFDIAEASTSESEHADSDPTQHDAEESRLQDDD